MNSTNMSVVSLWIDCDKLCVTNLGSEVERVKWEREWGINVFDCDFNAEKRSVCRSLKQFYNLI